MIRMIHYGNKSCELEGVYFTKDMDTPAEDFLPPSVMVVNDSKYDIDLPSDFCLDTRLEKVY